MSRPFQVEHPDGDRRSFDRSKLSGEPLSEWLAKQGLPLNTRCGCRGLCRGCQVQVSGPGVSAEPFRSCQIAASALAPEVDTLIIPHSSLHNESLYGVSAFELRVGEVEPPRRPGVGMAIDIGTTTVAGALWDLSSGRCLGTATRSNAQRRHGDNVVSRIQLTIDREDGVAFLQRLLLRDTLDPLIDQLCREAKLERSAITESTVVGNPTMLHLLAGESLRGLATFPFKPAFLDQRTLPPDFGELGIHCELTLLPGLAPFVGADITAGSLATGILEDPRSTLLIDFGTNGEILLRHQGSIITTATAAGPAFEGGNLACGAPAAPGVIASLARDNGAWTYTCVNGTRREQPRGISGAAFVDFIAIGYGEGWILPTGRLDPDHPEVVDVPDGPPGTRLRVPVTDKLFISEADIAEILQAKAAIAAGVAVVLEVAGVSATEIDQLYVGGGFGYHLQPRHAQAIGLLPGLPAERISLVGNSALGGASLWLLHRGNLSGIPNLHSGLRAIELNQIPSFEDHFTDALFLPD